MQKTRTNEEWLELVKRQRDSGQTMGVWCAANGVNKNTMADSAVRLRKIGLLEQANVFRGGRPRSGEASKPRFVELIATPETPCRSAPDIQVKIGAFTVIVGAGFDEAAFLRVCKALVTLC
jgi:hypothetical protein